MSEDIHTLVGAYALDAVDDLERARFDRHLASCPSCAQEVGELRETARRLADLTEVAPPARLREAVLAEVARTPQARKVRPVRGGEARWRRWTAAAVAAGIIAIGAAAATYVVEDQRVRDAQAQAAQVTSVLDAPDAVVRTADMAGGRVTVVLSASLNKGVAVVNGLPDPGTAKAYQLWLIRGEQAQSVGVLPAGAGGGTEVFSDVQGAGAFGVSNERARGADTPTKPLVGSFTL
jgi:Anti-sigma-K factor rskA, C-terminal/Anti-sigma-K factor RskA, N-terminal domain